MSYEDLLVDGQSIKALGTRIIKVWEGAYTSAAEVGDPVPVPGRDGVIDVDRDFDASVITLGLQLRGASLLTGFNDLLRALTLVSKPGRRVTLTRRLSYTTGNEEHVALGRYLSGLTPALATPAIGQCALSFTVLDGLWHGASPVTIHAGTSTVLGTTRTRRMTLNLPGAGTLTNTTTGVAVTVSSSANLDVENQIKNFGAATLITATGDELGGWFTLVPGSNVITWSGGGTPDISYYPAYL